MPQSKISKRGRPATVRDPLIGFRASPEVRASIVKWAKNQPDVPSLSEAIRRLVEAGLTRAAPKRRPKVLSTSTESAARAAELAEKAIDKHLHPVTSHTEGVYSETQAFRGAIGLS